MELKINDIYDQEFIQILAGNYIYIIINRNRKKYA